MAVSVLNRRQSRHYYHRADVWRVVRPVVGANGELGPTITVKVYGAEPCHYGYTQNIDQATGEGRVVIPGQFTRDTITFSATIKIRDTDLFVNVSPGFNPNFGQVHKVQGEAQTIVGRRGRINTMSFEAMVEYDPPTAILTAYNLPKP